MAHGFSNIQYACVEIFLVGITVNRAILMIQVAVHAFVGVSVMEERRFFERQLSAEKGPLLSEATRLPHPRQFANL
jgi:hypothetical protein